MKKLIVSSILFCVLSLNGMDLAEPLPLAKDENVTLTSQIKHKLMKALHVVNGSLDYLLTIKGATKTLVILTPFFILYCNFFDGNPIRELINRIFREIGKVEGTIELQKQMGRFEALWDLLSKDPLGAAELFLSKLLEKFLKFDWLTLKKATGF